MCKCVCLCFVAAYTSTNYARACNSCWPLFEHKRSYVVGSVQIDLDFCYLIALCADFVGSVESGKFRAACVACRLRRWARRLFSLEHIKDMNFMCKYQINTLLVNLSAETTIKIRCFCDPRAQPTRANRLNYQLHDPLNSSYECALDTVQHAGEEFVYRVCQRTRA